MCNSADYIIRGFNRKYYKILGILVYLVLAFDTMAYQKLLNKLENIEIQGVVYEPFESYISNRPQKVRINQILRKTGSVEFGMPQGTVLSPVLFSIYINNLFPVLPSENCEYICYADDKGKSWQEIF